MKNKKEPTDDQRNWYLMTNNYVIIGSNHRQRKGPSPLLKNIFSAADSIDDDVTFLMDDVIVRHHEIDLLFDSDSMRITTR